ncbi:protein STRICTOSIDINE SYNTHASE-LIKE 5-like [Rutidosis leptorrhynchoides]|uniref:protein STRICTOSIDINE SYNTHASE-LIKE 5-like n=1 Tax=Rutidosis leptorrhynchoides TaxID=125765 RepID=UPI003A9A0657
MHLAQPGLYSLKSRAESTVNIEGHPATNTGRKEIKPSDVPVITDSQVLTKAEYLGVGKLDACEDILYDEKLGVIFTGCGDGWIKKVHIRNHTKNSELKIENWVNTGGRPLGLAYGCHNELIVADRQKGLLNVTGDGMVKVLTDEAEGNKFNHTNAVGVASNGIIYFTDASKNYEPLGRFMSFNPKTNQTKVLVRDIYFPNGMIITPDQKSVIFCESPKKRCNKYNIKSGKTKLFIENLPARTDDIRYDGQGHYWIALVDNGQVKSTPVYGTQGGAYAITLEGKPVAHYSDYNFSLTACNKIGNHLYGAAIFFPYMVKFYSVPLPPPLP